MKNVNKILLTIIIFAAICNAGFCGTGFGATGLGTKGDPIVKVTGIKYQVNVHLESNISELCNIYYVVITDANGNRVAPAQKYILGVSTYTFIEPKEANGKRIASLIKIPTHLVCASQLYTLPDVLYGPYFSGSTYLFNLYPHFTASH